MAASIGRGVTFHLQAPFQTRWDMIGYQRRTAQSSRKSWRKIGFALLTEKIASKVWTTTKWAIYEGDVPITLALRSIFGVENDRVVEKPGLQKHGLGSD